MWGNFLSFWGLVTPFHIVVCKSSAASHTYCRSLRGDAYAKIDADRRFQRIHRTFVERQIQYIRFVPTKSPPDETQKIPRKTHCFSNNNFFESIVKTLHIQNYAFPNCLHSDTCRSMFYEHRCCLSTTHFDEEQPGITSIEHVKSVQVSVLDTRDSQGVY